MISVIIITRNEEFNIFRTIKALSDARINEIIIIDSNSSDKTVEIVNNMKDNRIVLKTYTTPPFTASRGRSEGVKYLNRKNKYILFLDGDMEYNSLFTNQAILELEKKDKLAGCMGQMDEFYYLNKKLVNKKLNIYDRNKLIVGGALFIKLDSYFKTPGFNPNLICDEEGFFYYFIKKNDEYFKRIADKMFIHHTKVKNSKQSILSRFFDKKLGCFGICLIYAIKDKNLFFDFISRNKKFMIVVISWLMTPIIYFFPIFAIINLLLFFYLKKQFINYTIYFFYGLVVFISYVFKSMKKDRI